MSTISRFSFKVKQLASDTFSRTIRANCPSFLALVYIWMCTAFLDVVHLDFHRHLTIKFVPYRVVMTTLYSVLVNQALIRKNYLLVLPWCVNKLSNMYDHDFQNLKNAMAAMDYIWESRLLPWLCVFLVAFMATAKIILMWKVIRVCIHIIARRR